MLTWRKTSIEGAGRGDWWWHPSWPPHRFAERIFYKYTQLIKTTTSRGGGGNKEVPLNQLKLPPEHSKHAALQIDCRRLTARFQDTLRRWRNFFKKNSVINKLIRAKIYWKIGRPTGKKDRNCRVDGGRRHESNVRVQSFPTPKTGSTEIAVRSRSAQRRNSRQFSPPDQFFP